MVVIPVTENSTTIQVHVVRHDDVSAVTVSGVLDRVTYRGLRDAIIKAALDEPRAVIVVVDKLCVPSSSAWSVFTSARWHVSTWPDVPILLVCERKGRRRTIASVGVDRYVPVHPTYESALEAVRGHTLQVRRRARAELPANRLSVGLARARITDWLTAWDRRELIPIAGTVATVFVENVLDHTIGAPVLVAESFGDAVSVAVEDCSQHPATRHEDTDRSAEIVSGLAIVSALCRTWGSTPTSSGKTVWALIGLENRI